MSNRLSLGPVQVYGDTVADINLALRELQERLDAMKGLRGRSLIYDRMRVDDPTEIKDAINRPLAATSLPSTVVEDNTAETITGTWTVTGSWTFDRDPLKPFTVTAGSAVVDDLDADKLDGKHASEFLHDYARDVVVAELVNDATETTMASFTVTGGHLGTDGAVKMVGIGDYLNNSGVAADLTVKVTYGGTTIATWLFSAVAASATRRAVLFAFILSAANSASAQVGGGMCSVGSAAGVTGQSASVTQAMSAHTSATVDSGTAQTLAVTMQHGAANANLSVNLHACHVVRIP